MVMLLLMLIMLWSVVFWKNRSSWRLEIKTRKWWIEPEDPWCYHLYTFPIMVGSCTLTAKRTVHTSVNFTLYMGLQLWLLHAQMCILWSAWVESSSTHIRKLFSIKLSLIPIYQVCSADMCNSEWTKSELWLKLECGQALTNTCNYRP